MLILLLFLHLLLFCTAMDQTPLLYDLDAECLGSTGHSAILQVSWSTIQSLQPPPPPVVSPAQKLFATLILIGEFDQHDQQYSRQVKLSDKEVHFEVPAWALQPKAFSSLLLKQAGVVVGRLEFVELGAMCGHHERHVGDVDGAVSIPEISIV